MRLLLDTHAALWAVSDPDALSATARNAILGAEEIRLSVVSPRELVVRSALGRLVLHRTVEDICRSLEREFAAQSLAVTLAHVLGVGRLAPHHGFAEYGVALVQA